MDKLAKEHPEIQKMLEDTVFNDIRKQDEKHKKRLKDIENEAKRG